MLAPTDSGNMHSAGTNGGGGGGGGNREGGSLPESAANSGALIGRSGSLQTPATPIGGVAHAAHAVPPLSAPPHLGFAGSGGSGNGNGNAAQGGSPQAGRPIGSTPGHSGSLKRPLESPAPEPASGRVRCRRSFCSCTLQNAVADTAPIR